MELAIMTKDDLMDGIFAAYNGGIDRLMSYVEALKEQSKVSCKSTNGFGKILIIGETSLKEQQVKGFCKSKGISGDRIEFMCGYDRLKNRGVGKYQYNDDYSLIIVGPVPHSMSGMGEYSSIIAQMEQEEGYPPVARADNGHGLKLTLSMVKHIINDKLDDGCIAVA